MVKIVKKIILLLSVFFISIPVVAEASGKVVTCQIDEQGNTTFKGKCKFIAAGGGSFALTNLNPDKPLFREIMDVKVYIVEPGVAEVRGLVKGGINSRWGQAIRSTKQKACWVGSDFKICAW